MCGKVGTRSVCPCPFLPWQQSGKGHTEDKEWNKITQINELGKFTRHWLTYRYPVKRDRNGIKYLL